MKTLQRLMLYAPVVAILLTVAAFTPAPQSVSYSPLGGAPLTGTTGSIGGGALIAGASATGTATITGATVGKPCMAAPSDGTSLAGLTVGVSVSCSITAASTATVVVTAAIAGTPTAKTYSVVTFP